MILRNLFKLSCAVGVLAAANPAMAQQPAAEASALGDIVVTANKRAENVQDIPATVTAVNADMLATRGVKDITDLTKVAPEVTIAGGAFSNVTIRGLRTGTFGPSTDSPNAVHIDGVYLSRFTSLQGMIYDLDRVEVLAGPQGTLYGRNSAGGALNIISKNPTDQFGGRISLDVGNYDAYALDAAINIPLTEQLAIRAAYYHNAHDGYFSNGAGDAEQQGFRLKTRWTPTNVDTFLVSVDHQTIGGANNGSATTIVEVLKSPTIQQGGCAGGAFICLVDPTTATPAGATRSVVPIRNASDPYNVLGEGPNSARANVNTEASGIMAQWDHDFGWANLTAQAAFRDTVSKNPGGGDSSGYGQDPRYITIGILRPGNPSFLEAHSKWDSQEIRLTSPNSDTFTWVAGAYRFHEDSYDNHNGSYTPTFPNTSAATIGQIIYPAFTSFTNDVDNSINLDDAWAIFGQATYTIAQRLHLTLGARYNEEEKEASGYILANGAINGRTVYPRADCPASTPLPGCAVTTSVTGLTGFVTPGVAGESGKRSFSRATYKANVAYDITDSNMIYADFSTGFKAGGFAYGSKPFYDPETVESVEIGSKNQFFDRKLQVNLSAWSIKDNNFTSTINEFYFDPTVPNTGIGSHLAAGSADSESKGQSVQAVWLVTDRDTLSFNAVHNDNKFTDFNVAAQEQVALNFVNPQTGRNLLYPQTAAWFDYSGTPVGNVMDYTGSAQYEHRFSVFGGDLTGQMSAQYYGKRLQGNQVSRQNPNTYFLTDPYVTLDTTWRYRPDGANWSLTGYVRNITGETGTLYGYSSNNANLAFGDPETLWAYRSQTPINPRTFGVVFNADF